MTYDFGTMKKSVKLRKEFDRAVANYIAALLKQFDWDAFYGYWVGDDCTGIYAYAEEYFISLADVIYIVDNNVSLDDFQEWYFYTLFASEYKQTCPNLNSWMKGCPRLSKVEQEKLRTMQADFLSLCEDFRNKINPF